ncbi:MAG: DUF421 domain-containing protein [Ardenticatenaceae bacterium]|nr:DUF421 domain-containing protein [Ardenticatenaceae bacterium]HBY97368.1 DUF421 domain-containing protein [Chloroflexota bacterium]
MPIWPHDWAKILLPQTPLLESMVRISVVYLFLVFLLRVVLKRESAGTSISDLLVIVLLADAVQNGMAGGYTSVGDALILAATLIFWDWLLSFLAYHQYWFFRLVRPERLLIIKDGKIIKSHTQKELLTREELEEQLHLQGIDSISEVAEAYVEPSGQVSVIPKGGGEERSKQRRRARF